MLDLNWVNGFWRVFPPYKSPYTVHVHVLKNTNDEIDSKSSGDTFGYIKFDGNWPTYSMSIEEIRNI